jgi:hypothetical protein
MEAIRSSETLATTYKATQPHNQEDHNRHLHLCEDFRFLGKRPLGRPRNERIVVINKVEVMELFVRMGIGWDSLRIVSNV